MKLFLKIFLFIFIMIATTEDAISSSVLTGGRQIQNTYASDGWKLAARATENNQVVSEGTKYYNGNLVFDINGDLEYILFDEGRILHDNGTFTYEYHLKDHLGSTRVAFVPNSSGNTVVQENAYYPFGATIAELSYYNASLSTNRYSYNGKELIKDFDIGQYDYGARFYNPLAVRWSVIDPMSEKYYGISPYSYVASNPMRFIDPTGMMMDDYFNEHGEFLGSDDAKTDYIRIILQEDWNDNKTIHEDGTESIDHTIGNSKSENFSEADMTIESILAVYDYYNPTTLRLKADLRDKKGGGMSFSTGPDFPYIGIKIAENNRQKIADHANEIINTFIHEKQHYDDLKKWANGSTICNMQLC